MLQHGISIGWRTVCLDGEEFAKVVHKDVKMVVQL